MLAAVVGEDKFLKGVSIYLKKRLFGNSVTEDLWDGISEVSGVDVAKIMSNGSMMRMPKTGAKRRFHIHQMHRVPDCD